MWHKLHTSSSQWWLPILTSYYYERPVISSKLTLDVICSLCDATLLHLCCCCFISCVLLLLLSISLFSLSFSFFQSSDAFSSERWEMSRGESTRVGKKLLAEVTKTLPAFIAIPSHSRQLWSLLELILAWSHMMLTDLSLSILFLLIFADLP